MIKGLVSVILPIYNMEKLISKCVKTITEQTYTKIEIILVNDGSTDKSLDICYSLKEMDDRIIVITKENGGASSARNAGISVAKGEWIMFVDPDDSVDINIILQLVENSEEISDIVSCCCNILYNNKTIKEHFFNGNRIFSTPDEKKELYLQLMDSSYKRKQAYTAIGVPWGKLYRSSFLHKYNLKFNDKLKRNEDNIFNNYAFYYARKIIYIDSNLYNYNYEHIAGYFTEQYNPEFLDIVLSTFLARKECLIKIGTISDSDIYNAYINEASRTLISVLKNGIFHEENKLSFKGKSPYFLSKASVFFTYQYGTY